MKFRYIDGSIERFIAHYEKSEIVMPVNIMNGSCSCQSGAANFEHTILSLFNIFHLVFGERGVNLNLLLVSLLLLKLKFCSENL